MVAIVVGAVVAIAAALAFVLVRKRRTPSSPVATTGRVSLAGARGAPVSRAGQGSRTAPTPQIAPQIEPEASPACRKFLGMVKELQAIPGMTSRLLQVLDDPKSSVDEIRQEVGRDQNLVALVLRMANSAIYGASGQVKDITESIVVLGYDTTRQLVMGRLSKQVLRKNDIWQQALWRHALATGLAAQACAREVKGVTIAHAFTGGLLHDIGKAVLHEASPEECVRAWKLVVESGRPSSEIERERLGTDHNEVGAELLKTWQFPDVYRNVARYHASAAPANRLNEKDQRLVSIVTLAGAVASWMGYDAIPDRSGPDPHEHATVSKLGPFPTVVDLMKGHVEKELSGLAGIVG